MIQAVIMAGGKGTRFWPLSRSVKAKQFLNVIGDKSLLEYTISRLDKIVTNENIWIVGNQEQAHLLKAQSPTIPVQNILAEPMGKNTAPCIAWAAFEIAQKDPDAVMVILPADHFIQDTDLFQKTIQTGVEFAQKTNSLVTLGIKPTYAHTGYGYIEIAENKDICKVVAFKEKPDAQTATEYIQTGRFFWNAGIFIWKASKILSLIQAHLPQIYTEFQQLQKCDKTNADYPQKLQACYQAVQSISIDYGIMEKAVADTYLIPANFDWNDIGNWPALENFWPKDTDNNAAQANLLQLNSKNNLVYSQKRLVALVDIENLIIVDTDDALLILPKTSDQKVKDIYDKLPSQYK